MSSGRMSGTRLRSTRPFCMLRSSCTIAWYVHGVRRGVTGSLLRSRMRRRGGTCVRRKSNSCCSACIRCYQAERVSATWFECKIEKNMAHTCISTPSFFAIGLDFSYRMMGFFLRLKSTAVTPCTARSSAPGSHEFALLPYSGREVDG